MFVVKKKARFAIPTVGDALQRDVGKVDWVPNDIASQMDRAKRAARGTVRFGPIQAARLRMGQAGTA